jgi:hypothetical protein
VMLKRLCLIQRQRQPAIRARFMELFGIHDWN